MKKALSTIIAVSMLFVLAYAPVNADIAIGEVESNASLLPSWVATYDGGNTAIQAKFVAAYDAQTTAGFDFGATWQTVRKWDDTVEIVYQPFGGGDQTTNLWGWYSGGVGYLMYHPGAANAYAVKNEMLEAWGALGHWNNVGWPIGNVFEYNGKLYQNFSKAFIECTPGNASSAVLHAGSYKHPREVGVVSTVVTDIAEWAVGQESTVSDKIIAEFDAQAAAEFDFGSPWQDVKSWDGFVMFQPFNGGDNNGNLWWWGMSEGVFIGAGFIMYPNGAPQAYSLINEMSEAWGNKGHWNVVGYPIGNQFELGGKIYQNFSKGYMECTPGDSGTAEFHADGYKTSVGVGVFTDVPAEIAEWAVGNESEISDMISDEFDAQATEGFDFGEPWQVIKSWDGQVMYQPFNGGSNTGNLWGWGTVGGVVVGAGFIMYSDGADQAYSLINEMSEAWGAKGHWNNVGYPIGNQFEHEGMIYQNFSKGYIVCEPGDSETAVLHAGEFFDITSEPSEETSSEVISSPSTNDAVSGMGMIIPTLIGLAGASGLIIRKRRNH